MHRKAQLTQLLNEWRTGEDASLLEQIVPLVYDELHRIARYYMRDQPPGHTLQATALVNEAFLRFRGISTEIADRSHFVRIVANVMRNILVDYARAKSAQKRGGDVDVVTFNESALSAEEPSIEVLALEQVLERLKRKDPRKVQIAEVYYFCGATYAEAASVLNISESTLHRELRLLRALLGKHLNKR